MRRSMRTGRRGEFALQAITVARAWKHVWARYLGGETYTFFPSSRWTSWMTGLRYSVFLTLVANFHKSAGSWSTHGTKRTLVRLACDPTRREQTLGVRARGNRIVESVTDRPTAMDDVVSRDVVVLCGNKSRLVCGSLDVDESVCPWGEPS